MDARSLAATSIAKVLGGQSLSATQSHPQWQTLPDRDRSFVQELTFGTLRWWPRLDFLLNQLLQRKGLRRQDDDVRALLAIGVYQLLELHTPDHAAVSATVAGAKHLKKPWATGLVNGVLRNFLRQRDALQLATASNDSAAYAHPGWMLQAFRNDWPQDWQQIICANNDRPPMSLRVNIRRCDRSAYSTLLDEAGMDHTAIPETQSGIVLKQAVSVERLPGFAEGWVSVQDGAAQLAAPLLDLHAGQRVLDACAAPGGKTAHILETEANLQELVAIDIDPERLQRTKVNLDRLGLNAKLIAADATSTQGWWDRRPFQRILLDAPCSGTGVIRRHPDIKVLRAASDIPALQRRQQELLQALWPLLAIGGKLLYVTCSILKDENQYQVSHFLQNHRDARLLAVPELGWTHELNGNQILPGPAGMDGFFYALLSKVS